MIWFFAEAVEMLLTILLWAPRELHLAETIFFGLLAVSVCGNCGLGIGFDNSVKPRFAEAVSYRLGSVNSPDPIFLF